MTNFFAVRMPPGPGGDEFVELLNKLNSRHRVSADIEKLTNFMRSDPDSSETHSPQGILAFEKTGVVQRLAGGHDRIFQMKSIGVEPFGTQFTSPLLQNHIVVGGSAVNSNFSLLSQEPGAVNAVDILMGTDSEYSSNVMWSSGGSSMGSVVKKEEPDEEYRPLFTLNPRPQQKTYPLFKAADALVKEEVEEDGGHQDSGGMEGVVKDEYLDDDEFGDSGDYEEESGEGLKEEANKGVPDDLSTAFIKKRDHYQCKLCYDRFSKASLEYHWSHHPACYYCGMRFNTEELLSEHKRMHTTCNVCGKNFASIRNLRDHMRIHTGEKPFQCERCEKSFRTREHLKEHTRVHTGEKPFVCEFCQKRFALRSTLAVHVRTHTGEKPYECGVCEKRFAKSDHLNRHRRVHFKNF